MYYRVYDYDVCGNRKDGYEVNGSNWTSYVIEITENDNMQDICKKLKKVGYLKKSLKNSRLQVDGFDYSLYCDYGGIPVCELRKCPEGEDFITFLKRKGKK